MLNFSFSDIKIRLQLKIKKQCSLKEEDKSGVETKRRRIGHQSHIKALSTSCTTLKEILCRDDSNGTKEGRHRSSKEATLAFLMQQMIKTNSEERINIQPKNEFEPQYFLVVDNGVCGLLHSTSPLARRTKWGGVGN
jgi:hypothetical protein